LWVRDSDEITNRTYRIEEDGKVRVPLIGVVQAGGLTLAELDAALASQLKSVLLEPDVHASIVELRSNPVIVTGSVKNPGQIQLRDRVSLMQVISMAGGLSPEAGYQARVTRKGQYGKIPLSSATMSPDGEFSTVEEDLNDILGGTGPAANLIMAPNDVVNIMPAPVIYVMGEVRRAGGLALARKDPHVSVLEALAMSEGMTESAAPQKALILRPEGSGRQAISIDLKKILAGTAEDLRLRPNDILYVPNNKSAAKTIIMQAVQVAASIAVGVTIVRAGRR
jgi:polysaccharide export outer membrane protein